MSFSEKSSCTWTSFTTMNISKESETCTTPIRTLPLRLQRRMVVLRHVHMGIAASKRRVQRGAVLEGLFCTAVRRTSSRYEGATSAGVGLRRLVWVRGDGGGRGGQVGGRWCVARGGGLDVGWAGLLLEDGVVAQALALALLAVAASWMALVTLHARTRSVNSRCAAANKVSLVGFRLFAYDGQPRRSASRDCSPQDRTRPRCRHHLPLCVASDM